MAEDSSLMDLQNGQQHLNLTLYACGGFVQQLMIIRKEEVARKNWNEMQGS
jgi:hypothetical protein